MQERKHNKMKQPARTRSRRQDPEKRRRKAKVVPFVFLTVLILLIGGIVTAGFYGYNRYRTGKEQAIVTEKPREVMKETFPSVEEDLQSSTYEISGSTPQEKAQQLLAQMTLEEKAAQLFIITPEQLTGVSQVVAAGNATRLAYDQYPAGGLVYFKDNLVSTNQVKDMLFNMKRYSTARINVPAFLSVDEEGGSVARIGSISEFAVPQIEDMSVIGATGDTAKAYEAGKKIGTYLNDLGFNLDFAPVADVLSNPENTVVAKRSFGADAAVVAGFSNEVMKGLEESKVIAVLKHFPGHGATAGDTHEGYAYTDKTEAELMQNDWIPFAKGIEAGADAVMVAHIAVPAITGDETPATLSPKVTGILRNKLGFQHIIITDALNMKAITQQYTSAEASVKALQAGADMLLMPENFKEAYQGVLDAVADNVLTEERINESVKRILEVKFEKVMSQNKDLAN